MATPQAITAVIRASKPDFKTTADKAAFAVHAILSVNGFSLRKVGNGVDAAVEQGAASLPSEEADLANWNQDAQQADGGIYSFLYVPESGAQRLPVQQNQRQQQDQAPPQPQPPLLLVKCLRLAVDQPAAGPTGGDASSDAKADDFNSRSAGGIGGEGAGADAGGPRSGGVLLVSLADVSSGHPPATLELQLDRYVSSLAPGGAGYEHLDELIRRVQEALEEALDGTEASSSRAAGATSISSAADKGSRGEHTTAVAAAAEAAQRKQEEVEEAARALRQGEEEQQRRDPLRDDRYPQAMFPNRTPPGWGPLGVGDEDLMPGGLPRRPGMGGLVGPEAGVPLGPRGLGGGMHVGPENPIFAGRLRHPRGGAGFPPSIIGGGGAVPGMRWDPIAPEGLQGWAPDDYTRAGRAQHGEGFNDIGRPQPGRGPDWDHMFG
ncbi:hypothetical protein Vretimale_10329 [Volvox reticuliferus]|uniref:PI31 proteasome regulator C-terminal domain-containing protein n=1 Tax=Volvox reticuliferus TaxID=1737510 RepID=A0A8J4FQX2_9CHLO|nr:hypothetical protein Vretifemale_12348 [Volvox reticuliferus]GIM05951.1 hypothetical protein Vretimale_10329 [Volvox reticuliferus]